MKKITAVLFLSILLLAHSTTVLAQTSKLTLTITPPLIKNNVSPGQIWRSYIKVVNNNSEAIDIYIQLVNFVAGNEAGTVKLTPLSEEEVSSNKLLINNWIVFEEEQLKLDAYQSKSIPFIVDVPEEADPGDHHVAILVGTKPPQTEAGSSSISISSMIGSLLMLNIGGDVIEEGTIREFSTDKDIYSHGEAKLSFRFQNKGNTILRPRGEIIISDFRGQKQTSITINHKTESGNIFPKDTRKWEYNWSIPESLLKMGRYKAELILGYGEQKHESINQVLFFWVVQYKPLGIIALSILLFVILLVFWIRRYVRKAVAKTQKQLVMLESSQDKSKKHSGGIKEKQKVLDLKVADKSKQNSQFLKKRSLLTWRGIKTILYVVLTIFVILIVTWYFFLSSSHKTVDRIEPNKEKQGNLTNEQFQTESQKKATNISDVEINNELVNELATSSRALNNGEQEKQDFFLKILNGSGRPGLAGQAKTALMSKDFRISGTANADNFEYTNTVIEFLPGLKKYAEEIAKILKLKANLEETPEAEEAIVLILGSDYQ